ncbi:calcium-binding protein, partial [Sulfuricurvum sp.]|uniref:calcium-binding protein n=1 Tax=Sulfuricurvum sp. TaxID=2025608 RepID=UPI00262B55DF
MASITALQGAQIASQVYSDLAVGGNVLAFYTDPTTDLQMALLQIGNRTIVAFRGTASVADAITDLQMGVSTYLEGLADQFTPAGVKLSQWINQFGLTTSNTTIVGHSLGGALAQYFGANTGFETLTYNAYGIGNEFSGGSYDNITNYVTMNDPVSVFPRSKMIGKTYMLQDENLTAALGHGISNFTSESSWVRGYSRVNSPHDIDVIDGIGNPAYELALMAIEGRKFATINGSIDDVIIGGEINNLLIGGGGKDTLYGMGGSDTLEGGKGNDTLFGGYSDKVDAFTDYLYGGDGFDTYISGNGDTLMDSDGSGRVAFEGGILTGGKSKEGEKGVYEGNGGTYTLNNGTLTFTKESGEILTIQKFVNGDLGIYLGDEPRPKPTPKPDFPSPLVLDLNGDGVTSTFVSETSTYFDLDNDGVRQRTGWVQSTDALLVFDKNKDGKINNGSELFGNNTILKNGTKAANGFEALREYDENKDGVIDAKDNIYNTLSLWQDANSDGVTDTGELHTLSELGVASINLNYSTNTDTIEERNAINQTSSFTTTDGTTQTINDVWFMTNAQDTARDTNITIKDTVAALPDFRGAGRAENLSVAMNENTALESAVTALLTKSTTATYDSLLGDVKNILALWTHTDNISATTTRGEQYITNHNYNSPQPIMRHRIFAYARDVAILESFWGQNFTMNVDGKTTSDVIGTEMSNYMTNAINTLTDTVLATLLVQQLYGKEAYDVTNGSFDYAGLFGRLNETLTSGTSEDKTTASNLLATLIHRDGLETLSNLDTALLSDSTFKSLLSTNGVTYAVEANGVISGSYAGTVEGGSENHTLYASDSGTVYGGEGNDIIYGKSASNVYSNATGHEELHGGAGNDIIYGEGGSDILYGDEGDDTLYANTTNSDDGSYGHDVLIGGTGNDTLVGTARNSTYIYNYGDGHDTIIDGGNVGYTPDILELRGIRFEDIRVGKVGNDMVITIKDAIDPEMESGSIVINSGMNSGKIESFILDDKTLDFATIQLIADGLLKDDIYTFDRGTGLKTIRDYGSINGDTLQFGEGITANDIMIKVSPASNDLIIAIKEDGKTFSTLSDKLTISGWFNADNRIETFTFSDGSTWDVNAILAHQGTDEADTLRLIDTNADTTLDLGSGNDTITIGQGNDSLNGGEGDDTINAGSGNDTLIGGEGDDAISGSTGNDTYIFNRGDGADTILDEDRYAPYYWNSSYTLTRNAGNDTLIFGEGIVANDIQTKVASNGKDLIIALKEEGKSFEELGDKITLKNWFDANSRIENFSFADKTVWNVNDIIATQATETDDIIRPIDMTLPIDIHLLGGDDYISTGTADDIVYGDSGNDIINTGLGNDTLIGGVGNDTQSGGEGDDTYVFTKGDGSDTIIDSAGNDTLHFTDGITQNNLVVRQEGNNLRVAIKETNTLINDLSDSIVIKDWFSAGSRIENFSFSDGTVLSSAESILSLIGSDENDTVTWNESSLSLSSGAGNDTITLGIGNDTLNGGTGNDILQGGGGNDTYIFNRGDGIDTITDVENYQPYYWNKNYTVAQDGGEDILYFGDRITADDLIVQASANSNDLIIAIKEDGVAFADLTDKITLKNWFDSKYRIENIKFSDGTGWDINDIVNAQGTDDADTVHLVDTTTDVTLDLRDGNDVINTGLGNDILIGGMGNDTLNGGAGNDTYVFEKGDGIDTLIDVSGIDALSFGSDITEDDIVVMADEESDDLIIALKKDGKSFDELSDKIVLKNWYTDDNRIESFVFEDGTILDTFDITELQPRDDENNYLRYLEHDNTIDALRGDDTIHGAAGDDTYLFNRGDGVDHITDIAGIDTLAFGSEITVEDIEVHADNNYLIIGLKEDGKPFDELSDKIYFKQIGLNDYGIENLEFVDDMIIDPRSLISTYEGTDGNDRIDLTYLRSINPTVSIDDSLIINAKAGNDTVIIGNGNNTVSMGSGDGELLSVGDGDNKIDAGTGWNKTLNVGNGQNVINMGDGRNTLLAGDGNNTIDTTQSFSTLRLGNGNNIIDVGSGDNIAAGDGNNSVLYFSDGYLNFYGDFGDGDNTFDQLDDGYEALYGGEGNVYLHMGNGDNRFTMNDFDTSWMGIQASFGDGNNVVEIGEQLSRDLLYDSIERNSTISVGDGDNSITVANGDDDLYVQMGSGNNTINFSADIDSVTINAAHGFNDIIQLEDVDIENSYYEWVYDETTDQYMQSDELTVIREANDLNIALGDSDNAITLSDTAQDYTLDLGNGTNTIMIGKEGSDNDYAMQSLLSLGDGNNEISVLNGDGVLDIGVGGGDNSILLSADLDDISIELGDGDNIITQMVGVDTDDDVLATAVVYYGGEEYYGGSYYYGNETIYNDTISLLLGDGDNDITISRTDTLYGSFGEGDNSLRLGDVKRSYLEFNGGENRIEINSTGSSYADVAGSEKSTIMMGSGSTLLTARYNEETIISTGEGADNVYTYESNDSYIVNIGDGSDAILDMYGTDKIIFGEGITKENLKVRIEFYGDLMNHTENNLLMQQFQYDANADGFSFNTLMNANLVIQYSDDPSDVLILANWYDSDSRIESFVFNDGSILSDHQIVSLIGTDEDDTVLGTEGGNTLHSGSGEDTISGGEGNDTYLYSRGDSHDLFSEDGGFDTIIFGAGITKEDLNLQKVDNNLIISLLEDGKTDNDLVDTITVSDWFNERGRIERFRFADGSTMELNEILSRVDADGVIYYGTPDVDAMEGTDIGDIIMARESDDIVNGYAGDDLLFGEAGNDTLDGGEGNDLLYGGEGNDTYMIDRNMGNDIVFDQNGTDTLRFAEGITSEYIQVWYDNNDLKIWVEGSEITLTDWYSTEHRIETLTFANGEIFNVNDMINLQGGEVKGVSEGSTFDVDDGGDTIYYAQEGNDTYRIGTYVGANRVIDAGGVDRIEFAEGISAEMLNLSYEGDDLIIELEGTSVRLSGWYTAKNRIESFAFTDGTLLVAEEVIALMSTDGDDSIRSLEEGNYINAGDGDDIYDVVNLSGMHTIEDNSGIDTIRMGAGISPDSLRITWVQGSDDILIRDKEMSIDGGLLIKNWYSPENRIETILFSDGNLWSSQDILDAMGSEDDDVYDGFKDQANIIHANGGSDVVSTFGFDDTLYGGAGNDALDAGDGDDTLIGEEGADLLFGGAGDDTYLFNRGFGKDMIFEDAFGGADSAGDDHIVLGAGIAYDDVIVRSFENDNNLYIALKEDGKQFDELSDVITIKDWFLSANRIESISFGDGDVMSLIDVMHAKAAEEGEAISALGEGGMLIGTNDEDTLIGNKGDDFILGLDGDDDLIGAEGNDTLIGGQGDDSLEGSEGNDTYFFGRGDAHDTIYDNATAVQEQYGYVTDSDGVARWSKIEHEYSVDGGTDTVYFGEGITADDLIVKNEGFDLLITLKDSIDDVLRIQDYYKPFNTIEFFGFSDATILSSSEFEALLFTPEDDDVTFVDDQDRILNGNEGDDTIHAGSGNDIIDGAGGDDTLNGGFGDDVYLFGRGSGHDTITDKGIGEWWQTRSGNDTIFFKEGISRDDLWVKEEGNDLLIAIKEEGKSFEELSDTLRIIGAFDDNNPFESVVFANGTNVSITALVNHAPEAQSETSHTLQDVRVFSGEVGATDIDGDVLTYTVSTEASHGTLSIDANGAWSYSVADGYMGTDSAIIMIDDGNGGMITQTLNFDVRVSAPTLSDSTSGLLEDTSSNGVFNVTNPIGGALVYEVLNASSKGAFS